MTFLSQHKQWLLIAVIAAVMLSGARFVSFLYEQRSAKPITQWQQHSDSDATIDHSQWDTLLQQYLVKKGHDRRFNYGGVSAEHKALLNQYVKGLQQLNPAAYNRDEQFAYWVNLYNALTVKLILDHYPVDSIKSIGSGATGLFGPWDNQIATINGHDLSLNNIEHGILRALWQDNRVHYVLNCASISCPDLLPQAITSAKLNEQLDWAATDYINHPKAIQFTAEGLKLSSIFDWFKADFGGDQESLMEHLIDYSHDQQADQLAQYDGPIHYDYGWQLNDSNSFAEE